MRVHLVDGTYELFRAYYGVPSRENAEGREVGATRQLLRSMLALLDRDAATHVAIAFDHVIESFRNEMFAGYKTGDGIEPALWNQFHLAEEACRALGLVVWPMVEFEADDALAAGAARYAGQKDVDQVVLCSPDKDLAQCVDDERHVVCWDRMRDRTYDAAGVRAKFGISPVSIPDWLALVGDSADGIPGVPRWGAKSSATVLAHYDHIQNIPDDVAKWSVKVRGAQALADSLRAHRKEARLYRALATLRTDVPLGESVADLRWRGPDRGALEKMCKALEDPAFLERCTKVSVDRS